MATIAKKNFANIEDENFLNFANIVFKTTLFYCYINRYSIN